MHKLNRVPNIQDLQSFNPLCKAILWDMDGTIMETEALHIKSTQQLLEQNHKSVPLLATEIENICYGQTDPKILQALQSKKLLENMSLEEFIKQKNTLIGKLLYITPTATIFNNEVGEFIKLAAKNGIKQVIVTSSEKDITIIFLKFLELIDYFEFIMTREDTLENKPSPLPYTTAMKKLGLQPENVFIFEDSTLGLEAALNSLAPYCKAEWYVNQLSR